MTPPSRDSETGLPQKKRYGATPTESVAQPWGRRELIVVGLVCGAFALALACASGAVGARIDDAATMTANLAGLDPVPACPSGAPEDQTYSDMHRTLSCKCPDDKTWMQPNLNKAQDGTICPVSADGSGACNAGADAETGSRRRGGGGRVVAAATTRAVSIRSTPRTMLDSPL
mmetsp:Transcript_33099/g.99734  ORF Transcript_33099/g.99734 Transcript_33099/m.99734 type:complete len:173 (-) Transcript_33099:584-1102(-)